jgi:hypothetical protein
MNQHFCKVVSCICATASSLAAQTTWVHSALRIGVVNREVNPTELWAEVEVANLSEHSATVLLRAYRYTGQEITQLDYVLEGRAKHTFKIELPFMDDVVSADGGLFDERLSAMLLGRSDSSRLIWNMESLKEHKKEMMCKQHERARPL